MVWMPFLKRDQKQHGDECSGHGSQAERGMEGARGRIASSAWHGKSLGSMSVKDITEE